VFICNVNGLAAIDLSLSSSSSGIKPLAKSGYRYQNCSFLDISHMNN
jgi:hypothetical protein